MNGDVPGLDIRAMVRGGLWILIPNAVAQLPMIDLPVRGLTMMIAPLFCGLVAGGSGARPIIQGILSGAIASTAFVAVGCVITGEFPSSPRGLVPLAAWVGYSTLLGAAGAKVASHGTNRSAEDGPVLCECGYKLTGNVTGICPECGEPVPQDDQPVAGEP